MKNTAGGAYEDESKNLNRKRDAIPETHKEKSTPPVGRSKQFTASEIQSALEGAIQNLTGKSLPDQSFVLINPQSPQKPIVYDAASLPSCCKQPIHQYAGQEWRYDQTEKDAAPFVPFEVQSPPRNLRRCKKCRALIAVGRPLKRTSNRSTQTNSPSEDKWTQVNEKMLARSSTSRHHYQESGGFLFARESTAPKRSSIEKTFDRVKRLLTHKMVITSLSDLNRLIYNDDVVHRVKLLPPDRKLLKKIAERFFTINARNVSDSSDEWGAATSTEDPGMQSNEDSTKHSKSL